MKYGGNGEVTLKVEAEEPRKLRIEVIDQGVGFVPVARDRPATEVGGWGLHLVQTLSNRWGVYEGSTHVWFEIDRTGCRGSVRSVNAEGPPWRALRGTRPLS